MSALGHGGKTRSEHIASARNPRADVTSRRLQFASGPLTTEFLPPDGYCNSKKVEL
jgi:hypothetical protein